MGHYRIGTRLATIIVSCHWSWRYDVLVGSAGTINRPQQWTSYRDAPAGTGVGTTRTHRGRLGVGRERQLRDITGTANASEVPADAPLMQAATAVTQCQEPTGADGIGVTLSQAGRTSPCSRFFLPPSVTGFWRDDLAPYGNRAAAVQHHGQ